MRGSGGRDSQVWPVLPKNHPCRRSCFRPTTGQQYQDGDILARDEGNQPPSPARPPSAAAHRCSLRTAFAAVINSPVLCWCGGSLPFYRLEVDGGGAAKQFGLGRRCHRELANPHRLGKHFSMRQVAMAAPPDVPWIHVWLFQLGVLFQASKGLSCRCR